MRMNRGESQFAAIVDVERGATKVEAVGCNATEVMDVHYRRGVGSEECFRQATPKNLRQWR